MIWRAKGCKILATSLAPAQAPALIGDVAVLGKDETFWKRGWLHARVSMVVSAQPFHSCPFKDAKRLPYTARSDEFLAQRRNKPQSHKMPPRASPNALCLDIPFENDHDCVRNVILRVPDVAPNRVCLALLVPRGYLARGLAVSTQV